MQNGVALLFGVVLFALIGISIVIAIAGTADHERERDKRTAAALVQAKTALLGFATGVDLAGLEERPGDLPCPDTNNDGVEDPCPSSALRLGRLPWRTLGLPDLRDGDGERLWYAVSNNFKNNPRTDCNVPPPPLITPPYPHNFGCLNSDTRGTITIRNSAGTIVNDGTEGSLTPDLDSLATAAIAIVISPGATLVRELAAGSQVRTVGTASVLDPTNYLDVIGSEDNAVFTDGTTDGFIAGPIYDTNSRLLVNDRILAITYQDLVPVLEQRVVREVYRCLDAYALSSFGLYPWAADIGESGLNNDYADVTDNRVGRLPESFVASTSDSGCPLSKSCMPTVWPGPPACHLSAASGWWKNWRSQIFYSVADAYKPQDLATPPACSPGTCLTVNSPTGPVVDRRYFVAIAGRRLTGQIRDEPDKRAIPANYLELENAGVTPDVFQAGPPTATFNDLGTYK
ncbi:MAG: hypothetical protein GEU92_20200 [Alphaproteobacteria bacterium]|nr:hypothetical protein [Alphaproteobacteria bacterium]